MSISNEHRNPNNTSLYFYKASKFLVINGLPSFIKWRENNFVTTKTYKYIRKMLTVSSILFIVMELGGLYTQKNLSAKQTSNRFIHTITHPLFLTYYYCMEYYEERVSDLLYKLCITLKNVYNDLDVERQMIRKTNIYSGALMLNIYFAMFSYVCEGILQAFTSERIFVTVITVWPDITDTSALANCVRVITCIMWWIFMSRVTAVLLLTILTTGCLSYQYKNIQNYFYSLNDIFDSETLDGTDNENCEQKFEDAVKVGIQMHVDTLWCTKQCQIVYSAIYSVQISVNVFVVCILMLQMANAERSLSNTFTVIFTAGALLSSTGILMWNAGDVTFEAALVPTAMYSSGWQNCRGRSSQRIRKLLVIAISQAQRHVVIRSFGVMEVSYQACVTIAKASYSAFSFLY